MASCAGNVFLARTKLNLILTDSKLMVDCVCMCCAEGTLCSSSSVKINGVIMLSDVDQEATENVQHIHTLRETHNTLP